MKSLGLTIVLIVVSTAATALGATFNVSNPTEFQSAMTNAAANNSDDVINVAAGTYNITTTLTYQTDDGDGGHTLTIQGAGAATTILSGGGTTPIMSISTDTGSDGGDAGGNIVVRALTFQDGNNTGSVGGGINIYSYYANVTCEDSIFTGNTADSGGGAAVLLIYGTGTFSGNTFSSNTSSSASSGGGGGFSAASLYESVTLTGNTFSNNSSASGGGGAAVGGGASLTVSGNTFSGNTAADNTDFFGGGGIKAGGTDGTVLLEGNEFSNNSAPSSAGGGAVVFVGGNGSVTVSDNSFSNNSAVNSGGAWVFSIGGGPVSVVRNTFSSNTASGQAGGAAAGSTNGITTFADNVFLGNSADIGGGLLAGSGVAANSANVVNNTFSGNTASTQGGGMAGMMVGELGTLNVYNNIFWNNSALSGGNDGDDVYVEADVDGNNVGGPFNLFNNDFSGAADFASAQSEDLAVTRLENYGQGNNIQQNPLFVNAGDVHLQSGSSCIDRGYNSAPSIPATDFDGGSRIVDGDGNSTAVVDIGADEFLSAAQAANAVSVPAMNEWGAFLFVVLAGLAAVSRMRRRTGRKSSK